MLTLKPVVKCGLASCLFLVFGLTDPTAGMDAPQRPLAVRVEEGRVINTRAPFSFALAEHWDLKEGATAEDVTVVHPESESRCSFLLKGGGTDLEIEARALQVGALTGGSWSKVSNGWRKIGGHRAGELVALRTYEGKETLRERSYAVIDRGQVYLIVCQVPESRRTLLEADVDRMLETFRWSTRSKKP